MGSDWPVQAGLAHVDVAVEWEGGQQGEQHLGVHVVVVIHVTQPSGRGGESKVPDSRSGSDSS